MEKDTPVFDRRDTPTAIQLDDGEWSPRKSTVRIAGVPVFMDNDGPSIKWRLTAQAKRLTSNRFNGQAANDNEDWPLQKLLRTEKNDHCLQLATRYRDLHDTASQPTQLIGKECDNLFLVENQDDEGRSKGVKVVTGKRAQVDTQPRRNMAAPVPKKWNGDWPIIAAIDAKRELAILRAKLAYVPAILEAFEWSVADGLTLDEIGKRLGAGSKGAKGEARARIFDGFGILDRYWRTQDKAAA